MKMKNCALACLSLSALLLPGCQEQPRQSATMLVDIAVVEGNAVAQHAEYPGQTEAQDVTNLSFRVMGTIDRVLVKEGDHVAKGQPVARMDSRDYHTQLMATESEYRQIKAECERVMAMHAEQAVSDNDFDKARSGLERITQALKHHRDQLDDCVLYAPYDCIVGQVLRSDKEAAGPGIPVVSVFTSGTAEVVINVPEAEYLQRGQKATYEARFTALPGRTFPLTLKSVALKANSNQLYQMRLALNEPLREITPGMSVMVSIHREEGPKNSTFTVPIGAVANADGKCFVYVYSPKAGTVKKTVVQVENLRSDGKAVVSGTALKNGDKVVASGVSKLTDNQQVKPLEKTSELNVGHVI